MIKRQNKRRILLLTLTIGRLTSLAVILLGFLFMVKPEIFSLSEKIHPIIGAFIMLFGLVELLLFLILPYSFKRFLVRRNKE
jgi:hypothetical protein